MAKGARKNQPPAQPVAPPPPPPPPATVEEPTPVPETAEQPPPVTLAAPDVPLPPATGTFDRIGLVTTATTSGKARFGIYDSDHATIPGAPKTLITGSDSAEIDTSAATADRLSTISVTLTGGHLYWLASAFNATTAAHHIIRTAMAASDNWGIQGNLSNANGPEAYYMSNAYGAMPSTVSSLVTIVMTTAMPAVFLRAA